MATYCASRKKPEDNHAPWKRGRTKILRKTDVQTQLIDQVTKRTQNAGQINLWNRRLNDVETTTVVNYTIGFQLSTLKKFH